MVNAVSRAGTNNFNGRTFFYLQDDSLNAVEHFAKIAGQENPNSGSKVFGASFGGPILRNRAFFFVNYERNVFDQAVSLTFPPEAAPLATAYTATAKSRTHNTFLRADYQVTPSHSLSWKFVNEAGWEIGDGWQDDRSLPDNIQRERNGGDRVTHASWMWVIGSRATNEMKVGRINQDTKNGPEALFDENTNFIELAGRDQFEIPPMNQHPDYRAGSNAGRGAAVATNYVIDDTFTFIKPGWAGDHTFKAGAGFYRPGLLPQITGGNSFGTYTFPTNLPFDPANPRTYPSQFSIRLGQVYFDNTDKRSHGFVQDRWQVGGDLTLNLGVRYDYQTLTPQTKNAIAPRLGFAWDPFGTGRTVVRGGGGKFYEPLLVIVRTNLLQSAVIAPSFIFQTDEDLSGLSGRIPAAPCLQPVGSNGRALLSPACRASLSDIRSRVAAGDFINTEPVVDGDRRMGYIWSFSARHQARADGEHRGIGRLRRQPRPRPDGPHRHQRAAPAPERNHRPARHRGLRSHGRADSGPGARRGLPARAPVPDAGRAQHRLQRARARAREAAVQPVERTHRLHAVRRQRRPGRGGGRQRHQHQARRQRSGSSERLRQGRVRQSPCPRDERVRQPVGRARNRRACTGTTRATRSTSWSART